MSKLIPLNHAFVNFSHIKKNLKHSSIFMGYEEAEKKSSFTYVIQRLLSKIQRKIIIYILIEMFDSFEV